MPDPFPERFHPLRTLLFRIYCIYLLLYFVFISDFASNYPILWHLDLVIKSVSNRLGLALNKAFFSPDFKEWRFFDSYWTYSKLAAFLLISVVAAAVWTRADKGRRLRKLFIWVYAFSKYYLAVAILLYSMWKLFETQFYLELKNFLLPAYYIGPKAMFWTFMASARSYAFFGGLVEASAVIFLLFRKTSTLGALIAFATLANILVMDAAYDTPIKVIVFHLMLFNAIVLWPDAVKLFRFLVLNKTETLSTVPPVVAGVKYKRILLVAKLIFMILVIVPMVKSNLKDYNKLNHPFYEGLVGIYEIENPHSSTGAARQNPAGPEHWKKFTIEEGNMAHILLSNDTILEYSLAADTLNRTITLSAPDSSFRSLLHYSGLDSGYRVFLGMAEKDSVKLVARQIDIHQFPLLKENGKVIWTWITPP